MPNYSYEGLNKKGQPVNGSIVCDNVDEAKRKLQNDGLYITLLEQAGAKNDVNVNGSGKLFHFNFGSKKVKTDKIVDFLRQLATLVEAKLPLVRALTALSEQEEDVVFLNILEDVKTQVQGGAMLADGLASHPRCFSRLAVNMVRAGETGGVLEQSLNRLADFSEDEQDMRSTVKSAMIYPLVLTIVMGLAITLLMVFAVPKFKAIYQGMHTELPGLTQGLITVADSLKSFWWIYIVVIVTLIAGIRYWKNTEQARIFLDKFKFKLPVLGALTKKIAISRFSRTFGTLVDGGIPILQALNIAKDTAGNVVLESALDDVSKNVKEGERIAKPLRASGVFPPVVIHMISVGEESGTLGAMLKRIADNYDKQSRAAIKAGMTILEPLIIVLLATIVTVIILAMLLPMLEVNMMNF